MVAGSTMKVMVEKSFETIFLLPGDGTRDLGSSSRGQLASVGCRPKPVMFRPSASLIGRQRRRLKSP